MNIISAFKSKTVWLLLAGALQWAGERYMGWNWFTHLAPAFQDLIVALYGVLLVWARNQAAKTGDVISLKKTVGIETAVKCFLLCALWMGAVGASAQDWGASGVYDFNLKETIVAPITKVSTLRNVFGIKGFNPDIDLFAGVSSKTNTPGVGGLAGKHFTIDADGRISVYLGIGLNVSGGQNFAFDFKKPGFCIGAAITARLR